MDPRTISEPHTHPRPLAEQRLPFEPMTGVDVIMGLFAAIVVVALLWALIGGGK